MKVLVVDDEKIVLESCRRVLGEEGFEVTLATSAEKALEAMNQQEFFLALIDIKMPVRDGISLAREVKEKWPKTPIIVMSGYVTKETVEEVSKMGAATFIPKPFTPDELLCAVRRVVGGEVPNGKEKSAGN